MTNLSTVGIFGHEVFLENLQANILKGHGRNHVELLFLEFYHYDIGSLKQALASLPLTSAAAQLVQTKNRNAALKGRRSPSASNESVMCLYLSSDGYRLLGINTEQAGTAFNEGLAGRTVKEGKENRHLLGDEPQHWEQPYQETIHGMLLVANEDEVALNRTIWTLEGMIADSIRIVERQGGKKLTNGKSSAAIEHFGYADGISQPLFFKKDITEARKNNWDPAAPLDLVLVKDFGTSMPDCYGSYLVYRKMEQNVRAFKAAETHLAGLLNYTGSAEEASGAMVVGRFEAGLPAVKLGSTPSPEAHSEDNDFDYALDKDAMRCPFHAHIRKVNPRGDTVRLFGDTEEEERMHRIARRGITYGRRAVNEHGHIEDEPEAGVGLLFMCFQASIENQFEHLQGTWANNNDFPIPFTGIDPIIGQGNANRTLADGSTSIEQQWRKADGSKCPHSLSGFVETKGGAYFFAPSLPFLKGLGGNTPGA